MAAPPHNRLVWIVCAVALDGLAAVVGAVLRESLILRWKERFLAAAAGVMLGVAFIEIFPEALEKGLPPILAGATLLGGLLAFYAVEQLFSEETAEHAIDSRDRRSTLAASLLFGDALHNITDGVAVASAFLSSINVGIALALAVFFHELPHETGDYAVLVAQGFSRKKAVFWMFLVQMSALIGAVGVGLAAGAISGAVPWLLAFSAGGFTYIAAAKLLPAVIRAREPRREKLLNSGIFLAGLVLAGALRAVFGA